MIESQAALELLKLGGVALVAMCGQEGTNFLLEESDLLGLEGLPACGGGEKQADQG